MKIIFLSDSEHELNEAISYYGKQSSGLDDEFMSCVDISIKKICENPEMYPIAINNIHKMYLKHFPYLIYYKNINNKIIIYGIFHCNRNPNIIIKRIKKN
jgi:hypothetical protein